MPPTKAEIKDKAVAEFCKLAYERRLATILAVQNQIDALPQKNDWAKLSKEARAKLEKPFTAKIAALNADKSIDWNVRMPETAEIGEVFKLPRTNKRVAINDQYRVHAAIDKQSVLAFRLKDRTEYKNRAGDTLEAFVVIDGLKAGEFLEKKYTTLKLTGMWYRTAPLQFDGTTHMRMARWPHEQAVIAAWPKFLRDKEKPEKDTPEN